MIKTIAIIVISVSILGLLLFIFVKNQIKKKIDYYLKDIRKENIINSILSSVRQKMQTKKLHKIYENKLANYYKEL